MSTLSMKNIRTECYGVQAAEYDLLTDSVFCEVSANIFPRADAGWSKGPKLAK